MMFTVVGRDTCNYTKRVRNILSAHGHDFNYYSEEDADAKWIKLKPSTHLKVPWVFDQNDKFIGGFTETQALLLHNG
jgi:glutaredoxin